MTESAVPLAAICTAVVAFVLTRSLDGGPAAAALTRMLRRLRHGAWRWRGLIERAERDGYVAECAGRRRLKLTGVAAGAALGYSLGGLLLAAAIAVAAPLLLEAGLRSRRRSYARRIDSAAAELALALASALAAGHSIRGALLAAGRSLPPPLTGELAQVVVDLTLGRSVEDALAAMRHRTGSPRMESLSGAIELHRRSGGDLVRLMRELAAAFRSRDLAHRDARAATAQARFTAGLVAAMPLAAAVLTEFAVPGSVTGVFAFAPAALMMLFACLLLAAGVALCLRTARV